MATDAAIRIDNRSSCQDLVAHLGKVTRNDSEWPINTINPTSNEWRWSREGNMCILQIVEERSESAPFVFKNRRESEPLQFRKYSIEMTINDRLNNKIKPIKIEKTPKVKKAPPLLQNSCDWS